MRAFLESGYYTALREATEGSLTDSAFRPRLQNLKGLGNRLYQDVIPSELKSAVATMSKGDILHIFADKPDIPWELVKNGGDFWGQLYIVSNSALSGRARVKPAPFTLRVQNILNVVGHGLLPPVAARARRLFDSFEELVGIKPFIIDGENDQDATDKFFEHLPTADLIHFTCHGEVGPAGAYLRIVEDKARSANFMVTSIGSDLRPNSIVFANACLSGETKEVIHQPLGFGSSFCEGGASAFIGTLDFVPGDAAVQFADAFYDRLFAGDEVGRALWAAKQVPLKSEERTSLVPLLYSLYGNPRGRLKL
jgi:hypothetical protein